MNPIGRRPFIPYAELEQRLRSLRVEHGLSIKELAQRLGYSVDHIRKLCVRFGIKIRGYNPNKGIDQPANAGAEYSRELAPSANVPAHPEAKPGNGA